MAPAARRVSATELRLTLPPAARMTPSTSMAFACRARLPASGAGRSPDLAPWTVSRPPDTMAVCAPVAAVTSVAVSVRSPATLSVPVWRPMTAPATSAEVLAKPPIATLPLLTSNSLAVKARRVPGAPAVGVAAAPDGPVSVTVCAPNRTVASVGSVPRKRSNGAASVSDWMDSAVLPAAGTPSATEVSKSIAVPAAIRTAPAWPSCASSAGLMVSESLDAVPLPKSTVFEASDQEPPTSTILPSRWAPPGASIDTAPFDASSAAP